MGGHHEVEVMGVVILAGGGNVIKLVEIMVLETVRLKILGVV